MKSALQGSYIRYKSDKTQGCYHGWIEYVEKQSHESTECDKDHPFRSLHDPDLAVDSQWFGLSSCIADHGWAEQSEKYDPDSPVAPEVIRES